MKNKLLILLIIVLLTTGCTCEYNLDITDNNYSEKIKMIADNQQQIDYFSAQKKIPTDKKEYFVSEKEGYVPEYKSELYNYDLTNNVLTLSHEFNMGTIANSTAIANCYDTIAIDNYGSVTTISTSQKVRCFDFYPELTQITVTINVDREVKNHNADYNEGNKYVWYIEKKNKDKDPINMTIDNETEEEIEIESPEKKETSTKIRETEGDDYALYIFCGILLIVMLIAYYLYNKLKKSEMDD